MQPFRGIWETLNYIFPLQLKLNLVSTGQALAKPLNRHQQQIPA